MPKNNNFSDSQNLRVKKIYDIDQVTVVEISSSHTVCGSLCAPSCASLPATANRP